MGMSSLSCFSKESESCDGQGVPPWTDKRKSVSVVIAVAFDVKVTTASGFSYS